MPAPENAITTEQMVNGLNIDLVTRFNEGNNRLMELLGIFDVEILAAGTALMQLKITGDLNEAEVAEGDETPLTRYVTEDVPVGKLVVHPYRKLTTAQAILQSGFIKSVTKTDNRMLNQVRDVHFGSVIKYLANGTAKASGSTLQATLAYVDSTLDDQLEKYHEATEGKVHFVNRFDIAGYLADGKITTQTLFGMTYLKDFLGIQNIFVTSKVPQGTVYATTVENLHLYGVDFEELKKGGLDYEVTDDGLIGVAHSPNYARTSCETYILTGLLLFAEIVDFIVVGTIGAATASAYSLDEGIAVVDAPVETGNEAPADDQKEVATSSFDPAGDTMPTMSNKTEEIVEFAEVHSIDLAGCTNKTQMLERIAEAMDA